MVGAAVLWGVTVGGFYFVRGLGGFFIFTSAWLQPTLSSNELSPIP